MVGKVGLVEVHLETLQVIIVCGDCNALPGFLIPNRDYVLFYLGGVLHTCKSLMFFGLAMPCNAFKGFLISNGDYH